MHVTVKTFRKSENELLEKITDKHGMDHVVWIVPVPFCTKHYLNSEQYLPGGNTPGSERWRISIQDNVSSLQIQSLSSPAEFSSLIVLKIHALRNTL